MNSIIQEQGAQLLDSIYHMTQKNFLSRFSLENVKQWLSQNAEKLTHIKGRLLGQAVLLFNWSLFEMGTSPRGSEFFSLRAVPYGMENHFYHIKCYFFYYARV